MILQILKNLREYYLSVIRNALKTMENIRHFFETNDILKKSNLTNEDIFDTEIGANSLIDEKVKELSEKIYKANITYEINSHLKIVASSSTYTTLFKSTIIDILDICWLGNIHEIYLEASSPSGWDFVLNKSFDFKGIKIISDQLVKLNFSTPSMSLKNLILEVNSDPKKIGIRIAKAAKLINCNFKAAQISCQGPTFPVLTNCDIKSAYTCLNTTKSRKKWPEKLFDDMSYAISLYRSDLKPDKVQQIIDLLNYDHKQWEVQRLRLLFNPKYRRDAARINFEHPNKSNNEFLFASEKN